MNIKKNLTCCATSPVCHFVALCVGFLVGVQLIHTHAHYKMDMDVDSYVHKYLRKNPNTCAKIDF